MTRPYVLSNIQLDYEQQQNKETKSLFLIHLINKNKKRNKFKNELIICNENIKND